MDALSRSMKKSAKSIARSDPTVAKASVMMAPACGARKDIVRRAPSARSSVGLAGSGTGLRSLIACHTISIVRGAAFVVSCT